MAFDVWGRPESLGHLLVAPLTLPTSISISKRYNLDLDDHLEHLFL